MKYDSCPYKKFGKRQVQKEDHVKTQEEDSHGQAKKRGFGRNQPC